jgi:hypothetical protein
MRLLERRVEPVLRETATTLGRPEVRDLMRTVLERAKTPIDAKSVHHLIIRSVSAKQRPRRAAPKSKRTARGVASK